MSQQSNLRIGTRASKLARLQTDLVIKALSTRLSNHTLSTITVQTAGDRLRDRPIASLGSRGVFVRELEEALLANVVDLVVHSLKDLPAEFPPGLILAAVPEREDPRDALVSQGNVPLAALPAGAKVATSSRRRTAQLKSLRHDITFVDIRGNVDTRLRKHDEGYCDAIVLAAAGLKRLGLAGRIAEYLDADKIIPAAGQGALAVECRAADEEIICLLQALEDSDARAQITAERAFLHELGGGCSVPIGALATKCEGGLLKLSACVAALDGGKVYRAALVAPAEQAVDLGRRLAGQMIAAGAGAVLDSLKSMSPGSVSPP